MPLVVCDDVIRECIENKIFYRAYTQPRAGSGVVRIDPLRFLTGCRTRRLFLFLDLSMRYMVLYCCLLGPLFSHGNVAGWLSVTADIVSKRLN